MTTAEVQRLHHAVKRVHARCLDQGAAIAAFMAEHPHIPPTAVRACAMVAGRAPYPSVDGNPPAYRERPFFDARFWARVTGERGPGGSDPGPPSSST